MTAALAELPVADGELVLPDPVGKQTEWLDSPATRKVLRVGRRGAKTRFAFIAATAGHGPGWDAGTPTMPGILQGGDVIWIAQDYPNLLRVVWLEEIEPRFGHLSWAHLNQQNHTLALTGLGTLFLASAEAINGIRGMGKNVRGIIVDEAAWLALGEALKAVILAILLDNEGWLIVMSTTNAGTDGGRDDTGSPQIPSYFNQICAEIQAGKRSSEWVEFYATAFDNPTLNPAAIQELVNEYIPGSPDLEQEVYAKLLESSGALALPGLSEDTHICPAFSPPDYWNQWLAFDWGYHHPWTLGRYANDDDGQVYKRDSLMGRLDLPEHIDDKVRKAGVDPTAFPIYAGPDVWRTRVSEKGKIVGQYLGPTVAEELQRLGWKLIPAADARVAGLNNLRRYTYIDPARPNVKPRFLWMDTPGNRACIQQIAKIPLDPKNLEDALKVNADGAGRGGDDYYDETRYGLMARPIEIHAPPPADRQGVTLGWDPKTQKPRERETGEQAMQKLLGVPAASPVAGRYRVPVRR